MNGKEFPAVLMSFVFALTLAATLFLHSRRGSALDLRSAAEFAAQEKVLSTTVAIEMLYTTDAEAVNGRGRSVRGLGTLVRVDGRQFIMTHNHWPLHERDLRQVELRDAQGRLLLTLQGEQFRSLVRFHDAGTMLLAAPHLRGVVPADLGHSTALRTGDRLLLATRAANGRTGVVLVAAEVTQPATQGAPARLRLLGSRTAVSPGDSGGGVWYNGKVVGNLWAIIESLAGTPWSWNGWFGGPGSPQPTGAVLAAPEPLSGPLELSANALAAEPRAFNDVERGPGRYP